MSTAQPPKPTAVYPDRSTTLILVGIVQVLLGCLCGLMALMMVAFYVLGPLPNPPQGPAMNRQALIPSLVLYPVLAVALVWVGIGMVRARRWAWTLTVVLSWMWLIVGLFAFVMFVFVIGPMTFESVARQQNLPREAMIAMEFTGGVILAFIYILLPGGFLVACHRESVRATCLRRDPKVRWTDRCPMPVLALSIIMAFSVVSMSSLVAYGIIPLFGFVISGPAAAAVILSIALVMAYLAWGTYRLHRAAWWGMLLLWIAGTVNAVVTFARTDLMEVYEKMGMPADQLDLIRKSGVVELMTQWGPWMTLVSGAGALGYLLYVRRYFVSSAKPMTETIGTEDQPG